MFRCSVFFLAVCFCVSHAHAVNQGLGLPVVSGRVSFYGTNDVVECGQMQIGPLLQIQDEAGLSYRLSVADINLVRVTGVMLPAGGGAAALHAVEVRMAANSKSPNALYSGYTPDLGSFECETPDRGVVSWSDATARSLRDVLAEAQPSGPGKPDAAPDVERRTEVDLTVTPVTIGGQEYASVSGTVVEQLFTDTARENEVPQYMRGEAALREISFNRPGYRFLKVQGGVVQDTETGLFWQSAPSSEAVTFPFVRADVSESVADLGWNWKLPTREQVEELARAQALRPANGIFNLSGARSLHTGSFGRGNSTFGYDLSRQQFVVLGSTDAARYLLVSAGKEPTER